MDLPSEALRYQSYRCDSVAVTRGGARAWVATKAESFSKPAENASIVDTMGAGDAFIGGFLVDLSENTEQARSGISRVRSAA